MKKNILFLVFAFVFLLPASRSCAEEVKTFAYDSSGKRDPFIPPVRAAVAAPEATDEGATTEEKTAVKRPDLVLEGIIYDPAKGSFALIGGELLKEGDRISDCDILKIEKMSVALAFNGEAFNLELKVDEPSKSLNNANNSPVPHAPRTRKTKTKKKH